jgi:hypothetical protein
MSPSEQREFLDMADSDPNIRRILKADQVISTAISRDLAALPPIAAEPSAQLLSKLAASNPVAQQVAANSAASTAGSSGGIGSSVFFGSKIVQAFLAVAGTAGVVVSTLVLAPMLDSSKDSPTETPAVQKTGQVEMNFPAPAAPDEKIAVPAPREESATMRVETSSADAARPADATLAPTLSEPAGTNVKQATTTDAATKQLNTPELTPSARKSTEAMEDQEPPVIHSDSVHLKLNVE